MELRGKDKAECLRLIQLVRENSCIWDRTHALHNNSDHIKATWNNIAEQLDFTIDKTRARWKNLRDSYRLQLYKRIEAFENGKKRKSEGSWPLFDEMSFLEEHMYRKAFPKKKKPPKLEPVKDTDTEITENDTNIRHIEMVTVDDFDTSVLDYLNQSDWQNAPSKKQSILVHPNRSVVDPLEDEDRSFFDSLLPYMKLLPPKHKMMCRMRIQEIIFSIAFPSGKKEESSEPGSAV